MFGTILKEVSGYFDKTALITAFFPSLIFWGATIFLIVDQQNGWNAAIKQWEGWSGTIQGIALIAFFAWVTFWSFLTVNFRPFVVRLYEGYWSEVNPIVVVLKEGMRRKWKKRRDKLDRLDRQLQEQKSLLKNELKTWEELTSFLKKIPHDSSPVNSEQSKQEVINFLKECNDSYFFQLEKLVCSDNPISENVANFRLQVSSCWEKVLRCQFLATESEKNSWNQYRQELTNVSNRLLKLLKQKETEVQERIERIDNELFRYYPTERAEIMPTQLGNVLKASEMYAGERYNLDAVLIWPRLLPALPKEFVESFSSAKVSLDLMVTLSAYVLLFGLPLAVWLAAKSSVMLPAVFSLELVILAVVFRLRIELGLAILVLALTVGTSRIPLSLKPFLSQLQVFIILATNVLLAARLTYQNAVQAAVAYGEQIKAAFDLYRWKALEGLNLQLPPNLTEERKLWGQVCGLLYRNYSPDFNYYRYVKQTNTKDPTPDQTSVSLPVPAKTLPAYRSIVTDDFAEKEMPEVQIPTDAVRQREELIGYCPLQPLIANHPISRSVLVEQKYLTDTIAVGIQATPAMTLGGRLKAGDIADIVLVSDEGATSTTLPSSIVWENILILDVRSVTASNDYPFVVVIALPKTLEKEFASVRPQARWLIASKC
jgi:hypothetical protein